MLSADRRVAAFGGIWSSGQAVYRLRDTAVCFWNQSHRPPKRRCSCGFYCLHSLEAAQAMACEQEYRSTVILMVEVTGRFIRYEEGFRYSSQRVTGLHTNRCGCGRPVTEFVDSGTGIRGWVRLRPCCHLCGSPKEPITLPQFASLLGDIRLLSPQVREGELLGTPASGGPGVQPDPGRDSQLSLLTAEVALLQARVDSLQAEVSRLRG